MPLTSPRLTVRLGAVRANYRRILEELGGVPAGAAVKADAYGLGVVPVVRALFDEGCREFFVATVDEGAEVRSVVPDAAISVFNGVIAGTEDALLTHDLVPLAISREQLERWAALAARLDRRLPVGLHFDTGINRTGLTADELEWLVEDPRVLDRLDVRHVMSHLASADEIDSPQSQAQLDRFREIRTRFPHGVASLANSAGIFRGAEFHFDLGRPGIAIYGGSPIADAASSIAQTVTLEAPMLQVRDLGVGERVGYGATHEVTTPARHAVVGVGYADGYLRSGSNRGQVAIGGHRAPVVGRVSMDLTIVDVTAVPDHLVGEGCLVELIGEHCPVDEVAAAAGTISYEILTSLGDRYDRVYED